MAKRYEDLQFTDDFMFCKVMSLFPNICKRVTEVITGRKIRTIVQQESQKSIEITEGNRGVRFDVYFEDEDAMYDIEMQTYREEAPLLRSRYYQSLNDLACLERGSAFTQLKESYIIFIGLEDFFDAGLSCYLFEKTCPELPGVHDGTHTIFVNASGLLQAQGEDYANLMAYLTNPSPTDSLTREIDEAVDILRDRRDLRREFVTLEEKLNKERLLGRKEGFIKGREEGRESLLTELLNSGLITEEAAKQFIEREGADSAENSERNS